MCNDIRKCKCGCAGKQIMFSDRATFDKKEKTIISVRDGVQEYLGIELGIVDQANKLFKVFRSRETIEAINDAMMNLPVTDGHVSLEEDVPEDLVITNVTESATIDLVNRDTSTTIALKNKVATTDNVIQLVLDGVDEFSLGYHGDIIKHDEFDFEQINLQPHHLAVVELGRCGPICSFQDQRKEITVKNPLKKLLSSFTDQDSPLTLQQLLELVAALPEAIKNVPMEQLQELGPSLAAVVEAAKEAGIDLPEEEIVEETEETEETEEVVDEEVVDEEVETEDEDGKEQFSDEAIQSKINAAVQLHSEVIVKAQDFVDEDYDFKGKSTIQIMKDAVATQHDVKFTDAELSVAFKTLQPKGSNYQNFADSVSDPFKSIRNKEL